MGAQLRVVGVPGDLVVEKGMTMIVHVSLGPEAPDWLAARGLPSRLVNPAGQVTAVGGWPPEGHDVPCP